MYIVELAVHTTGPESDESAQTYSVDQQELKKNHLWLVEVSTSSQTHNSYIHWITSTVLKVNHRPIGCSSVIIAGGISSPWQNSRGINCAATSSAKLNLPNTSLLYSLISTGQHPDSIQNSSHLLPHCLRYSSSILLWVAFSTVTRLTLFAQPRIFRVLRMGRTFGERSFQYIGPVIWNSLPCSFRHSSSLKSKLKTHLFSSAYWFVVFLLLLLPTYQMKWCLMSSDVGWHIRDKLRPMPKHGSINLYVHGSQKAR